MTKGYYFNYFDIFHITQPDEVTARGLGGVAGVIQRIRGRGKRDPGVKSSETEQPDQSQIESGDVRLLDVGGRDR